MDANAYLCLIYLDGGQSKISVVKPGKHGRLYPPAVALGCAGVMYRTTGLLCVYMAEWLVDVLLILVQSHCEI